MGNFLVEMRHAGYCRTDKWLVRGVDLTVSKNEIVTLIGPNGSGKSTSLKLALGLLSPSEGTVEKPSSVRVAYLPQKLAIDAFLPLSVNRLMSLTSRPKEKQVERALAMTGVSHLAHQQVQSLSGGELQRVLLARAIVRQPDLLVLDEPVQGVDFSGEIALYELIREIHKELGCGVLLVSHDLHLVMAATDKVLCLNGHVCCTGTPELVAQSLDYRRLFGERAAKSLAVYQHHHDHTHLPDGRVVHAEGAASHQDIDHGKSKPATPIEAGQNPSRDSHAG